MSVRTTTAALTATLALGGVLAAPAATAAEPHDQSRGSGYWIDQILRHEPDARRGDLLATVNTIAREAHVSRAKAAEGLAHELSADTASVAADARAAARVAATRSSALASRLLSSSGDGGRIHLPAAHQAGDIVYAPNVSSHFNHGHAALFTTKEDFIHAPGDGQVVQEVYRMATTAKSFAVGAKMMSVHTDNGDGPLLSARKRGYAVSWARSRKHDQYRSVTSPNAKVVTGVPGSAGSKQNCSQLVWAAYKVGNNYDMNPVPTWEWVLSPTAALTDKLFVWPEELVDDPHTQVYRTVYTDGGV